MRTYRATILGLCAVILMTIGLSTPAESAVTDCQSNETCVFAGTSYVNPHYDYNRQTSGCINVGGWWKNNIGSIVNNTNRQVWAFKGPNCWTGGSEVLDGLDAYHKVSFDSALTGWNNNIESLDFD